MRTLVAFYSKFGTTRAAGKAIAGLLKADVEDIVDLSDMTTTNKTREKMKKAFVGKIDKENKPKMDASDFHAMLPFFLGVTRALLKIPSTIKEPVRDPRKYDLVIVGTPIWAGALTPAVRAYIKKRSATFKKVAFFCTMIGSGGSKAFSDMQKICKKTPVGVLELTSEEVQKSAHMNKVKGFVKALPR